MFLVNGMKAQLIKYNRKGTGVYDDEYTETENIVLCPYNQDVSDSFGIYSHPEAKGYFILKRATDVKEGDQIVYNNKTYTIIDVKDNWIWNKMVNYTVAVK